MQVRPSTFRNIHLQNLSDAPPRLQRLLLNIQPYDFVMKYIPGKEVALADVMRPVTTKRWTPPSTSFGPREMIST